VARFARADDAYDALSVLRADRVEIDAAVALDSAAAAYAGLSGRHLIAVRSRGPAPTVSRVTDQVAHAISAGRPEEASSELWNDVAEAPHRAAIALRVSVPESRIRATVADQSGSLHYVGSGIAYLLRDTADAAWIVQRRAEAESADGACVVERAPAALRSAVDTWGRSPVPLPLARRLKSAFDPKGVLSPGRFAGGI
jgi:glycolate oxidase FAD binding subunit